MTQEPDTHHSSTLEKIIETRFLADLTSEIWRRGERRIEVMTPAVDNAGVDILLEVADLARHIQLKTLTRGGKRVEFSLNTRLAHKPAGCVIVIQYDPGTLEIGPFLWFGAAPGETLPGLGSKLARHTKGNKDGLKLTRPGHRVVRRSAFELVTTLPELIERLFGSVGSEHDRSESGDAAREASSTLTLIRSVLTENRSTTSALIATEPWLAQVQTGEWEAIPPDLTYEDAGELAHLVDGYRLIRQAALGDPVAFLEERLAQAQRTGRWSGSALELWLTLFLLYRSDRQAGEWAATSDSLRDGLCRQLRAQLLSEAGIMVDPGSH